MISSHKALTAGHCITLFELVFGTTRSSCSLWLNHQEKFVYVKKAIVHPHFSVELGALNDLALLLLEDSVETDEIVMMPMQEPTFKIPLDVTKGQSGTPLFFGDKLLGIQSKREGDQAIFVALNQSVMAGFNRDL